MIDCSILGDVLKLFPEVTAAVEEYKAAKPGRESSTIARRLTSEAALYSQFTHAVLLLSDSTSVQDDGLHQHIADWLKPKKTEQLTASLQEMQRLLRAVMADLVNTRRGTEVLDKLGPREATARSNAPKTILQRRLDKISKLNVDLATYLLPSQVVPLSFPDQPQPATAIQSFFHCNRNQPAEAVRAINTAYKCGCQGVHLAGVRCACQKCNPEFGEPRSAKDEWAFEIAFPSATQKNCAWVAPLSLGDHNPATLPPMADLCSLLKAADEQTAEPTRGPETSENCARTYVSLDDLVRGHSPLLDQKKRMALAFQLSSAVLQFAGTPLVDEPWGAKDWIVAMDGGQTDEPPSLFVLRKLSASQDFAQTAPLAESSWRIASKEPTLARLGLALVELALGRPLSDIRKGEPGLLDEKDTKNYDSELLDLFTARKLLSLRHIAQTISPDFQDVVSACITQQYRDRRDATIKELDPRDSSFFEHATIAILTPLYQEVCKYHGYNHVKAPANKTPRAEMSLNSHRYAVKNAELKTRKMPSVPKRRAKAPTNDTVRPSRPPSLQPRVASGDQEDVEMGGITTDRTTELALPPQTPRSEPEAGAVNSMVIEPNASEDAVECGNPAVPVPPPRPIENQGSLGDSSKPASVSDLPIPQSSSDDHGPGSIETDNGEDDEGEPSVHVLYSVPQSCDSDAISSWSYGTYTESADSVFAWLPDDQLRASPLPEDHPFLGLREVALRVLMRCFRMWTEAPSGGTAPSGQSSSTLGSQADSTRNQSGGARKRPRLNSDKKKGEEEDEEEEDEDSQRRPRVTRKRIRIEDAIFACPFLKKDPIAHRACCGHELKRIRDVKQHLRRKHSMPIYCPCCIKTFDNEDQRDAHVRDAGCVRRPHGKPEGITEAQKKQLAKKVSGNQSPEEQWFGIFDTLFPDHENRPRSPYMDKALLRSSAAYQEFLEEHGSRILSDFLRSQGVTLNPSHGAHDLATFEKNIFGGGFRAIFDQWTRLGGTAVSVSDSHPGASTPATTVPTQGSSEIGQSTPMSFDQTPATAVEAPRQELLLPDTGLHFNFPFVSHAHNVSGLYGGNGNAYMMEDLNAILNMHVAPDQDVDMYSMSSGWFSMSEQGQGGPL